MPIEKLIIENYKVFKDRVEIDLSKHPVHAFVGKNASGKSSILDAVNKAVYRNDVRQESYDKSKPARVEIMPQISGLKCYKIRSSKGVFEPLPTEQEQPQRWIEPDFVRLLKSRLDTSEIIREVCENVSSTIGKSIQIKKNTNQKSQNPYPFNVEVDNLVLNPHQLSAGTQAILTMEAILNYPRIGEQDRVIFLIEEPETFLHPNLLRDYMTRLIEFFTENSDRYKLLISTHSSVVLSMLEPSQVIRVADGKVYPCSVDFKGWYMMTDQNKAELFFADRVILLEGFTDKVVYSFLLQGMGVRPEKYNVSIMHTDGAYNREKITEICESYGIKTLYVADKDQARHRERGGKDKNLSYEIMLEYGELEDAPTLMDYALALGDEFLEFIYYRCVYLSKKRNNKDCVSFNADEDYENASNYFRRNKVNHALKLGQLYAKKPIENTHPLYPLFLSLKDFIEQGKFKKPEFNNNRPSLEDEIKQHSFFFIEKGVYNQLKQEDICNVQEKIIGTFFAGNGDKYRILNNLIRKLMDMGIFFRVIVGRNYDMNALRGVFMGYNLILHENYALIDDNVVVVKLDDSLSESKKHALVNFLIFNKPINPDLFMQA